MTGKSRGQVDPLTVDLNPEDIRIERLLAESSLGTSGARRLRERSSREARDRTREAAFSASPVIPIRPHSYADADDDAERIIGFMAGLAFGLSGRIERMAAKDGVVDDDDMPDEDDAEFAELNERARMLAERALYHDDAQATQQLQMIFSPLIVSMKNSVEPRLQSDLVSTLTVTTIRAIKQAIDKRTDRPLAYTLKALRNEYIRFGIREKRGKLEQPMPEGFDISGPA